VTPENRLWTPYQLFIPLWSHHEGRYGTVPILLYRTTPYLLLW